MAKITAAIHARLARLRPDFLTLPDSISFITDLRARRLKPQPLKKAATPKKEKANAKNPKSKKEPVAQAAEGQENTESAQNSES